MIINFILKYWLVFIIGGVILLMMIIGYLANENSLVIKKEKTPKPEKEKKDKKNKIIAEDDVSVNPDMISSQDNMENLEENTELTDFLNDTPPVEQPTTEVEKPEENSEVVEEEPFEYNINNNEEVSDYNFNNEVEGIEENTDIQGVAEISEVQDSEETAEIQNEEGTAEIQTMDLNVDNSGEQSFEQFEELYNNVIHDKPVISDELKKYMDEFQIVPQSLESKKKEILSDIKLPTIQNKKIDDDIWDI